MSSIIKTNNTADDGNSNNSSVDHMTPPTVQNNKSNQRKCNRRSVTVIALLLFVTIGVIIGVAIGIAKKSKDLPNNMAQKNSMSCNSNLSVAMDGFIMMPLASLNLTNDIMTMDSMELLCMGDDAMFQKIQSEMHTMENGDMIETVWFGAMLANDQKMGFATLVQFPNGDMAGSFTTNVATYSLMLAPDGTLQMKLVRWSELPDEGDSHSLTITVDTTNNNNATLVMETVSIPTSTTGQVTTVIDQVGSVLTGTFSRFLRESRQLQTSVIRVLLIVTHRAMCENAGLSTGCTGTTETEGAFTRRVPILVSQTNTAMQGVGVDAQIEIVGTIFLVDNGFDANPDVAALDVLATNPTVAGWRSEYSADLLAMITGRDTTGTNCGIGYINHYVTATDHTCLDGLTLTHELGHNMGALHNREDSDSQHEYAHGYRQIVSGNSFRTVMSYDNGCNCQRIPYFSANGYFLNDQPIGTPTEDNARLLRTTAPRAAALV